MLVSSSTWVSEGEGVINGAGGQKEYYKTAKKSEIVVVHTFHRAKKQWEIACSGGIVI